MRGRIYRLHTYQGKLQRTPCLCLLPTHRSKRSVAETVSAVQRPETERDRERKIKAIKAQSSGLNYSHGTWVPGSVTSKSTQSRSSEEDCDCRKFCSILDSTHTK